MDCVNTKRTAKENITVKSVKIVPPVRTSKTTTKDTQKFARNLPQDNADSKVIVLINIKNIMSWMKGSSSLRKFPIHKPIRMRKTTS